MHRKFKVYKKTLGLWIRCDNDAKREFSVWVCVFFFLSQQLLFRVDLFFINIKYKYERMNSNYWMAIANTHSGVLNDVGVREGLQMEIKQFRVRDNSCVLHVKCIMRGHIAHKSECNSEWHILARRKCSDRQTCVHAYTLTNGYA